MNQFNDELPEGFDGYRSITTFVDELAEISFDTWESLPLKGRSRLMAEGDVGTKHAWAPSMYANYWGLFLAVAHRHGYALAIHGSMRRDFDLIAVPWQEEVPSPEFFVWELCKIIEGDYVEGPEERPHGRMSYTIGTGGGGYIDISVMKRAEDK